MSSIFISNIPSTCSKDDLEAHFSQRRYGGGPVHYILHPLGLKHSKALVSYRDASVMDSVLVKEHEMHGQRLKVSAIPRQMYTWVKAGVDPVVISGISNLTRYVRSLEREYGVKVQQSATSGDVYIEGSLIQIQCVQQQLESKHREHQQQQQQELMRIGQPDSMLLHDDRVMANFQAEHGDARNYHSGWADDQSMPALRESTTAASLRHTPATDPLCSGSSTWRGTDDRLTGRESTYGSQEPHKRDALYPMRQQYPTDGDGGIQDDRLEEFDTRSAAYSTNGSMHKMDDKKVEEMFSSRNTRPALPASSEDLYHQPPRRYTSSRYATDGDAALYESMPVWHGARPEGHDRHQVAGTRREAEDLHRASTVHGSGRDGTKPPGQRGLTEPMDPDIVAYMWQCKDMQLAQIQSVDNVDFQIMKADAWVQILITSTCAEANIVDVDNAERELTSLYQNTIDTISKETLTYNVLQLSTAEVRSMLMPLENAFATSIYVATDKPGEITLIGNKLDVAVEFAQRQLKAEGWSNLAGSSLGAGSRSALDPDRSKSLDVTTGRYRGNQPGEDILCRNDAVAAYKTHVDLKLPVVKKDIRTEQNLYSSRETKPKDALSTTGGDEDREGERKQPPGAHSAPSVSRAASADTYQPTSHADMRTVDDRQPRRTASNADTYTVATHSRLGDENDTPGQSQSYGDAPGRSQSYGDTPGQSQSYGDTPGPSQSHGDAPGPSQSHEARIVPGTTSDHTAESKNKFEVTFGTDPGVRVKVYTNDLTRMKVDAIVNPANSDLNLMGGLSYSIKRAADEELQEECVKYVSLHGPLNTSEVFTTKAGGSLKCKYIIHVVGPTWTGSNDEETIKNEIRQAVFNCLQLANDDLVLRSIALPAISTGIFNVPEYICARGMFEAIKYFCTEPSISRSLRDIRVVNLNPECTEIFSVIFKQLLSSEPGYESPLSSMASPTTSSVVSPTPERHKSANGRREGTGAKERTKQHNKDIQPRSSPKDAGSRKTKTSQTKNSRTSTSAGSGATGSSTGVKKNSSSSSYSKDVSATSSRASQRGLDNYKERSKDVPATSTRASQRGLDDYKERSNSKDAPTTSSKASSQRVLDDYKKRSRGTAGSGKYHTMDPAMFSTTKTSTTKDAEDDNCPICMEVPERPKKLTKCGHLFCTDCIEEYFENHQRKCPTCGMLYGIMRGDQPRGGTMRTDVNRSLQLPGYEDVPTIVITYNFPSGKQQANHPNPGAYYTGITRTAYLPANTEGREVLRLLKKAFDSGLMFTIGESRTTGSVGVITYNDIHVKTQVSGGPTRFGYPDPMYLTRVKEELAAKGVTSAA